MLFVFIYVYYCPTRFPYRMIVLITRNTISSTSGAGTAYHAEASKFDPGFYWCSCRSIFSFLCRILFIIVSLFVSFLRVIVSSVFLWFTAFDYPCCIFNFFL